MVKQAMVALAAIGAAAVGVHAVRHGTIGAPLRAAAPAAATVKALPRRPTVYGLNLAQLQFWTNERAFMNLMAGAYWFQSTNTTGAKEFPAGQVDREGTVLFLADGEFANAPLSVPQGSYERDVAIRCTFDGRGEVGAQQSVAPLQGAHSLDFTWPKGKAVIFTVLRTDRRDPVRHIDCREKGADRQALFDPMFLDSLKPYKVARVNGWQPATGNTGTGEWGQRTLPTNPMQAGPEGVAVEHVAALINAAGFDPWFTLPWKGTDEYQENFARYMHDHLDPSRTIYIEVGNEIWNMGLPPGPYVQAEARARNLDKDDNVARMRRYAQHSVEVFRIWQRVYGKDSHRVVRVMSGQAVWPDLLKHALDFQGTAKEVDAIAMAPYFGMSTLYNWKGDSNDVDGIMKQLTVDVDASIEDMRKDKVLADSYGLRLLGYEAGQHLLGFGLKNDTIVARLNRDPRMGDLYRRYLAGWRREAGDVINMFVDVSRYSPNDAFGITEHPGQPLAETPKRRAILEAIAAQGH